MIPWRKAAAGLSSLDPDLKRAFEIDDSALPAVNLKKILNAAPELASEIDTSDLEDSIRKFSDSQAANAQAAALSEAAKATELPYRIARTAAAPGLEAVSAAGRAAGLLGPEQTPGDVVKGAVGGKAGAALAGATDVVVDPLSWLGGAAARATGLSAKALAAIGAAGLAKGAAGAAQRSLQAGAGDANAAQEDAIRLAASVATSMVFPFAGAKSTTEAPKVAAGGAAVVPEVVSMDAPPRIRLTPGVPEPVKPLRSSAPPDPEPPSPPTAARRAAGGAVAVPETLPSQSEAAAPAISAPEEPAVAQSRLEASQASKVAAVSRAIDKATAPPPPPPDAASSIQKHIAKAEAELSALQSERPRKNAKGGAFEAWDSKRAAVQARVEQLKAIGAPEIEWAGMVAQKLNRENFIPQKGDDLREFIRSYATNKELADLGMDPRRGNPNKERAGRASLMERLVEMESGEQGIDYSEQSEFQNDIIARINAAGDGPVWSRKAIERGAGSEIRRLVQESGVKSVESFSATTKKLQEGRPVNQKQLDAWVKAVKALKSTSLDVDGNNFDSYMAMRDEYLAAKERDLSNLDAMEEPPGGYESAKPARPSRAGAEPRLSVEEAARRAGNAAPPTMPDGPEMVIDYSDPPAEPPAQDVTLPDRSGGVSFGRAPASVERPGSAIDAPMPTGTLSKIAAVAKGIPDLLRNSLSTVRSDLIAKGYPNVAQVLFREGSHAETQTTKASVAIDRLKSMGVWSKGNLKTIGRIIEEGPRKGDSPEHIKAAEILSDALSEQYDTAARKDPLRGDPDLETLAGVAPRERRYFPRTKPDPDVPTFIPKGEAFRPLTTTASHKSPNIYAERDPAANSVRVTDPDQLESILMEGAKTTGALVGGANAERTPQNYPNFFRAAYQLRINQLAKEKMTEAARKADAFAFAKQRVEMEQLPDVWEAAARDRPNLSLDALSKDETIAKAADMVIRNRSNLTAKAKAAIDTGTGLAATMQLGHAAWLNASGLVYPALWASKMGAGPARALGASIKAAALAAKYSAEDAAMAAGRAVGVTKELSPSQLAFGMSHSLNPFRRMIAAADRNTRLAVADAMTPFIKNMPHDWFMTTDHSLPMTDPRNIEIARRELANASQGLGSRADKLKDDGGQFWNIVRHLSLQYSSPELRQLEQNSGLMSWQGAALAALAGVFVGEGINDARAISRGTGLNLPGSEPTEDQKAKGFGKAVLSTDRDPRLPQRIAQNLAAVVPGSKTVLNGMEYGDAPGVGVLLGTANPAAGAVTKIAQAVNQYRKTGDIRAFLATVEAPGIGREWSKIIAYEQARKDAKNPTDKTGLGRVSQNMGWPWKIDLYLKGKITRDQLVNDTMVGGNGLPMEQKARAYRKEQNDRKAREEKQKEEKRPR